MEAYEKFTSLCLLLTVVAFAQSDRGTITGTVVDASAAVVPGAKIIARNTATGAASETSATECDGVLDTRTSGLEPRAVQLILWVTWQ